MLLHFLIRNFITELRCAYHVVLRLPIAILHSFLLAYLLAEEGQLIIAALRAVHLFFQQ